MVTGDTENIMTKPVPVWAAVIISALAAWIAYAQAESEFKRLLTSSGNAQLSSEMASLRQELELAKRQLASEMDGKILDLKLEELYPKSQSPVDCTKKSYNTIKTSVGILTLKCENIQNHLDGYKVKLALGNLTSATIVNPKVSVLIKGASYEADLVGNSTPGKWAFTSVVIPKLSTDDLKNLEIRIEPDVIALY